VNDRAYWLAWSQVEGIGSTLLNRIQQKFGDLRSAWETPASDLTTVEGIGPQTLTAIQSVRQTLEPEAFLRQHIQKNPHFWTPGEPEYPQLLQEVVSYPPVLYRRGQVHWLEADWQPAVAIVGTREPSEYGRRWTRRLTTALVQRGFAIVSGMAEGVDTEAHQACLEVGGKTLAVLGCGVDVIYPPRNRGLYQKILEEGLILSEYPSGTKPDRGHFPQRNRIIAGLTRAVIVTEAPEKSGALITAHQANDYGRDVYIVPGSLDNPKSRGCLNLIQQGAQLILDEHHLLDQLTAMPGIDSGAIDSSTAQQLTLTALDDLDPEQQAILDQLTGETLPLDLIIQQTGLPANVVSSALLGLELQGLVSQLPGMRYQRN